MQKRGLVLTLFLALAAGASWAQTEAQTIPGPDNKGRWITKAPVPTERTEVSVAELDGKLWLIGGYVLGSVTANLVQSYDPKTDKWTDHAAMPIGVNHVNVVGYKGRIYAFGGFIKQNQHPIANAYVYDVATNRWHEIAPLPFARAASSVVVLNDKIHLIGGAVGGEGGVGVGSDAGATSAQPKGVAKADEAFESALKQLEGQLNRFPPWETAGPPPINPNAWPMRGKAKGTPSYNPNGNPLPPPQGARTSITDHDIYDPATNTWSKAAPLPLRRDHIATVVYDGKIHAIGGRVENFFQNTTVHHVYDPATDSWWARASQPTPRSGASAAVLDGLIVVVGGEGTNQAGVYADNEAYDPKTDTWRTLAPMSVPRHGTGAAVIDGVFYMPGGATGRGGGPRVATNEGFTFR